MSDYTITTFLPKNDFERLFTFRNISLPEIKKPRNNIFSDALLYKNPQEIYIERENAEIESLEKQNNKDYYLSLIKEIEDKKDIIRQEYSFNPPNHYVLNFSKNFILNLIKNNLKPFRITASAEEGLCFVFKHNKQVLYFEIYNDKEMGYIIEDEENKSILENKDVFSEEEIIKRLVNF